MLNNPRIVLVNTSHPGNIGAAARAMKTMGLDNLALVQPKQFPCAEATARASGADDVLACARVYDSLREAVADCTLIIGGSARSRRSIPWPVLDPAECADKIKDSAESCALLFGREDSGLSNEELDLCHYLVHIPANPAYSSLNLAASVQILAYEIRRAHGFFSPPAEAAREEEMPDSERPADHAAMENFYARLEYTLSALDFYDPAKPRRLMRRLHRLFNRAQPKQSELNILNGILTAALKAAHKDEKEKA